MGWIQGGEFGAYTGSQGRARKRGLSSGAVLCRIWPAVPVRRSWAIRWMGPDSGGCSTAGGTPRYEIWKHYQSTSKACAKVLRNLLLHPGMFDPDSLSWAACPTAMLAHAVHACLQHVTQVLREICSLVVTRKQAQHCSKLQGIVCSVHSQQGALHKSAYWLCHKGAHQLKSPWQVQLLSSDCCLPTVFCRMLSSIWTAAINPTVQ